MTNKWKASEKTETNKSKTEKNKYMSLKTVAASKITPLSLFSA